MSDISKIRNFPSHGQLKVASLSINKFIPLLFLLRISWLLIMDELILVWFNKSELYLFPVLISLTMYNGYLNRFELIFQAPSFGNHRENIINISNTIDRKPIGFTQNIGRIYNETPLIRILELSNIPLKDGRPNILFSIHFVRILFLTHNLISYCFCFQ